MIVKIISGSWAKKYNMNETETLDLKDGASISDALAKLPVPIDEIGVMSINGKAALRETELHDGDKLEIFPMIVDG